MRPSPSPQPSTPVIITTLGFAPESNEELRDAISNCVSLNSEDFGANSFGDGEDTGTSGDNEDTGNSSIGGIKQQEYPCAIDG